MIWNWITSKYSENPKFGCGTFNAQRHINILEKYLKCHKGQLSANIKLHFPTRLCPTAQDKNMQAWCTINIPVYSVHFLKENPTILNIFKYDNYIQISDKKPAECPGNCHNVKVLQNCWHVTTKLQLKNIHKQILQEV